MVTDIIRSTLCNEVYKKLIQKYTIVTFRVALLFKACTDVDLHQSRLSSMDRFVTHMMLPLCLLRLVHRIYLIIL